MAVIGMREVRWIFPEKPLQETVSFQIEKGEIAGVKSHLDRTEREIEAAYRRWEELEALNQ